MSWANPTVARLASGDLTEDACGGVLICSWPMPSHVLAAYQAFAARLKAELPSEVRQHLPGRQLTPTLTLTLILTLALTLTLA